MLLAAAVAVLLAWCLMGWIVGEALIFQHPHRPPVSESVYFVAGVAMAALDVAVWRRGRAHGRVTARRRGTAAGGGARADA